MTVVSFFVGLVAGLILAIASVAAVYWHLKRRQSRRLTIEGYLDLIPDLSEEQRRQVQEIRRVFLPKVATIRHNLYLKRAELADLQTIDAQLLALPQVGMGAEFAEAVTVRVCKDFLARDGSPVGRTGLFGRLANLLEALFELLEASGSPRTRTLDEFSDFPPLSMGYVYCRLLGLCRGD